MASSSAAVGRKAVVCNGVLAELIPKPELGGCQVIRPAARGPAKVHQPTRNQRRRYERRRSDCHYREGNFKALRRVLFLKRLLKEFGIDERRLRLEWISASEGEKFASVANEFTEEVRAIGLLRLEAPGEALGDEEGSVLSENSPPLRSSISSSTPGQHS